MTETVGFRGAIFDVDGVLVDSPHELAWREAFRALMEGEWRDVRDQTRWTPEQSTPAVYQQVMAGKPRMAGARAAMEHFGVPDIDARIEQYAAAKQEHVIKLIEEGRFMAFPMRMAKRKLKGEFIATHELEKVKRELENEVAARRKLEAELAARNLKEHSNDLREKMPEQAKLE